MIARNWHGTVKEADFDAYAEFLIEKAIPDYQQTEGFVKLTFLKSRRDGVGHFKLITYWESLEVIRNFAGDELDRAKYYEEDQQYLLYFEERVEHYEVFAEE